MTELFRNDDPQADRRYLAIRSPRHEDTELARNNCEELWQDFKPFASAHFLGEFPYRFHQRWFEMYLTVALLRAGLTVVPSLEAAPDVCVVLEPQRKLWVEATAPTGGEQTNPDHVAHRMPSDPPAFGTVPREQVMLRVRGALHDKARKISTYRGNGTIAEGDLAVVAISIYDIPHATYDPDTYAAGAVYGVGDRYITIDRATRAVVDSGFQHRAQLVRASGSTVDAAPFLRPGHEHVAAALISSGNAAGNFAPLGRDVLLLPNPNAAPLYPQGLIHLGCEWLLRPGEAGAYNVEVADHRRSRP